MAFQPRPGGERDGVDRDKPPYDSMTPEERRHAMFCLDRDTILTCDVFLFVLDGRVPDEGACVELGIAYCHKHLQQGEKLLVGLHTDARAAFVSSKLNPMVRVPLDYVVEDRETLLQRLSRFRSGTPE